MPVLVTVSLGRMFKPQLFSCDSSVHHMHEPLAAPQILVVWKMTASWRYHLQSLKYILYLPRTAEHILFCLCFKSDSPTCSVMAKTLFRHFFMMIRKGKLGFYLHSFTRNIPVVTRECRRNSRKTTWFPPLGKMRPLPATASQGKSPVPP